MLPSAARDGIDVERYMDAWFGLLDVFIDEAHARLRSSRGANVAADWEVDAKALRQSYGFREWAFGVAQHYGLPSTGLDLTPDLDVETFFALHRLTIASTGETTIVRLRADAEPVILFMSIFEGDLRSDKATTPPHLVTPRAVAQNAHFFRTSVGSGAEPSRGANRCHS